ncbi:MAG TPA: hypothetical protein VGE07_03820 [Herpetosiphonaceae bacterium]
MSNDVRRGKAHRRGGAAERSLPFGDGPLVGLGLPGAEQQSEREEQLRGQPMIDEEIQDQDGAGGADDQRSVGRQELIYGEDGAEIVKKRIALSFGAGDAIAILHPDGGDDQADARQVKREFGDDEVGGRRACRARRWHGIHCLRSVFGDLRGGGDAAAADKTPSYAGSFRGGAGALPGVL